MHEETWVGLIDCADCGSPVDLGLERGYRVAENIGMCWACTVKRGGLFDEDEDLWLEPPDLTGLYPDVDHKVN